MKNKGELTQYFVENTHEAIIPAVVFEAVQAEMKRRRDLGPKGNKSLNLCCFSSIIKCSCCGCSFQRSSRKNRNGTDGRYVVWICATSRKGDKCEAKTLPEIALKKTCCEVLGLDVFSEDVFTEQIDHIDAIGSDQLDFHFRDGHIEERTYAHEKRKRCPRRY